MLKPWEKVLPLDATVRVRRITLRTPLAGTIADDERTFDVYDKFSGKSIGTLASMRAQDVDAAVRTALHGFAEMAKLTGFERHKILTRVSDLILSQKEKLTSMLISETGMTSKQADFEVGQASNILRLYSTEIAHLRGDAPALDADARGKGRHGYWFRVPAGVVGAISAFNNPLVLLSHKLGPSIAAGNASIFKPASLTPMTAVRVCEMFIEAGLPSSALNVLTGCGEVLGPVLVSNPHVRVVSFTGGRETGEQIARTAGAKRLLMELGSNCPNIVCSDAELDFSVDRLVDAAYSFQGQNCLHAQRIFVEDKIYEEFKRQFVEVASRLRMGDPRSPSTNVGPMISESAAIRVETWVDEAVGSGAKMIMGGRRSGVFYEPTLLEDVPFNMKVVSEEVFGPVSVLIKFSNLKEAVRSANSTDYDLQAAIFTHNIDNVLYALRNLKFAGIMINESTDFRVDMMPFGGSHGSGLGREGIKHSIEAMTEIRMAVYNLRSVEQDYGESDTDCGTLKP